MAWGNWSTASSAIALAAAPRWSSARRAPLLVNLIYGFASFAGTFSTFALVWLVNGYFQSFGSPGMIKINAAWFNRSERGTFSGIFGFMIQLGQVGINNLAPLILAGFAIGAWSLPANQWRWLFRIPPIITAIMAVLVAVIPRETPEAAGYPGCIKDDSDTSAGDQANVRVSIKECFVTIFSHPLVWFYALAYAATGAVRHSSDQLSVLFFTKYLKLDLSTQPRGGDLDHEYRAAHRRGGLAHLGHRLRQALWRPPLAGGGAALRLPDPRGRPRLRRHVVRVNGAEQSRRVPGLPVPDPGVFQRERHPLDRRRGGADGHRRTPHGRICLGRH